MAKLAVGWTALSSIVTYANSWVADTQPVPEYRIDGQGVLWFRGSFKSGNTGLTICTFAAGYRPGDRTAVIPAVYAQSQIIVTYVESSGALFVWSGSSGVAAITGLIVMGSFLIEG